jgi:hypothetical protein
MKYDSPICGKCGLQIQSGEDVNKYYDAVTSHKEDHRCIELLRAEVEAKDAQLCRAREE